MSFSFLPSVFTILNLFLGYLAIQSIINKNFISACYYILGSVILDGFDGTIARLTKTNSDFGVQLDSLVDAISFGVTPALMIYLWGFHLTKFSQIGIVISFFYVFAGVTRLARFNIFKNAHIYPDNVFIGLPIPAAALAISSIILVFAEQKPAQNHEFLVLSLLIIVIGFLMVSTIKYLTNKIFNLKGNLRFLLSIALLTALLIKFPRQMIPVVTILYLISPLFLRFFLKKQTLHQEAVTGQNDAAKEK